MAWARNKYVRLQDIANKVTIPTMSALLKDASSDLLRRTCASPIPSMWRHFSWGRGPAQSQAAKCAPCYHSKGSLARQSHLGSLWLTITTQGVLSAAQCRSRMTTRTCHVTDSLDGLISPIDWGLPGQIERLD